MDEIFINNLRARGVIGITDQERANPQDILINLTLYTDIARAGESDAIEDCINYSTMAKKVMAFVEKAQRFTVEALATDIARLCLENSLVQRVRVKVEKSGVVRFTESVGVVIERQRE